jgi:DNA-binding transcriptional LysR family regulator
MASEIDDLVLFAQIARGGSLTAAAAAVGLPKSTVSRRLVALEARLKTSLVLRSTRKLALTDAGHELHDHALRIVEELAQVKAWATRQQSEPSGRLRMSMPADFAQYWLADAIASFCWRYPKVRLEMDLSPRRSDLVAEGLDCAVRIGELPDSALFARKLTQIARSLYVSPLLLATRALPTQPSDLATWPWVEVSLNAGAPLLLRNGKRRAELPWQGQVVVNSVGMLRQLVLAGAGVGLLADVMCEAEVRTGRLQRLLPAWQASAVPAWVLLPSKNLPARTRAFVEHLAQALQAGRGPAAVPGLRPTPTPALA